MAKADRTRIVGAVDRLAETPHLGTALKGDLRELRRLRVGDHRVLYEMRDDELIILASHVAHQREAYRRTPT